MFNRVPGVLFGQNLKTLNYNFLKCEGEVKMSDNLIWLENGQHILFILI